MAVNGKKYKGWLLLKTVAILKQLKGSTSSTNSIFIFAISACTPTFRTFKETVRSRLSVNENSSAEMREANCN